MEHFKHFNITFGPGPFKNEINDFLNSSALEFYKHSYSFDDPSFENSFKAALLSAIIDFERTIKGTFGCDLSLKTANIDFLKRSFPNLFGKIFLVRDNDDLIFYGRLLETLRNINAHAMLDENDYALFRYKGFSYLSLNKNLANSISFYKDGLTVAGIIYIVLNMLREESVATLTKKSLIFSCISEGWYKISDGRRFVSVVSKVNLELDIREKIEKTLIGSIIGDYPCLTNGCFFETTIEANGYPSFSVKGAIKDNEISINKGSLSKVFYENDYCLKIEKMDAFIECSSKLPPFVLVDYLYKLDIHTFGDEVYQDVINNKLLPKLNRPKYYIDKNIDILLLPKDISNFRHLSGVVIDSIVDISLWLENALYKKRDLKNDSYSTLTKAFQTENMPKDLASDIAAMRNFSAHGYILNECSIRNGEIKRFTLDFVLETLAKHLNYVKENDSDLYNDYSEKIKKSLALRLISGVYKSAIKTSREAFNNDLIYDLNDVSKKHGAIANSYFDIRDLSKLGISLEPRNTVIKIIIEGHKQPFYLNNSEEDVTKIKCICESQGFEEVVVDNNSILKVIYLKRLIG